MVSNFAMAKDTELDLLDWGRSRWLCNPANTGAEHLIVIDVTLYPGKGHNFHRHPDQEEAIYVIAGTVEQWVAREKRMLGPGDSAFIPVDVVHASFGASPTDARLLAVFGPCVGETGYEVIDMADVEPWKTLRGN